MFGIIGTLVFGAVFAGSWIVAESDDEFKRNRAKENNSDLYFDKNGKMRHASGRKYTRDELLELAERRDKAVKERIREIKERRKEETKVKYWVVEFCKSNDKLKYMSGDEHWEVFDNYEKAIELRGKLKKDYDIILTSYTTIGLKLAIEVREDLKDRIHFNFVKGGDLI